MLLLLIALAVLILGGIYVLCARLFPPPVPLMVVGGIALVLLLLIASGETSVDVGHGRR